MAIESESSQTNPTRERPTRAPTGEDRSFMTCFFCQTLLSDHLEGLLPPGRKSEIEGHLSGCKACSAKLAELRAAIEILHSIGTIAAPETFAENASDVIKAASVYRVMGMKPKTVFASAASIAIAFAGVAFFFPEQVPWLYGSRGLASIELQRYDALANGASEIVDEQANWLNMRGQSLRSVWEEGGISPEDFDKTFQTRSLSSEMIEEDKAGATDTE